MNDRFVSPVAPPEGLDRELITIAAEELDEIVWVLGQIITAAARAGVRASKALRFGVSEVQPGQQHSNAYRLGSELGDLLKVMNLLIERDIIPMEAVESAFMNLLIERDIIPMEAVESAFAEKDAKLRKFLQSQAPAPTRVAKTPKRNDGTDSCCQAVIAAIEAAGETGLPQCDEHQGCLEMLEAVGLVKFDEEKGAYFAVAPSDKKEMAE